MKKLKAIGLFLAVMFAVLAWFGTASAFVKNDDGTITVVKGDNPSKISYKLYGTSRFYPQIMRAAEITNPKRLPIGKRFAIPKVGVIKIKNFNTSPFGGKAIKGDARVLEGIKNTSYSEEYKDCMIDAVNSSNPGIYKVEKGDSVDCMSDKKGIYCNPEGYVYGYSAMAHIWRAECEKEYRKILCDVILIDKCGNLTPRCREEKIIPSVLEKVPEEKIPERRVEIILPPKEEEVTPTPKEIEIPEIPPVKKEMPPTEEEKYVKWEGRVEAFLGAGKAWDSHSYARWNYADITLYPFSWETEEGRNYLGFGGIYNNWYGEVPEGRFSGRKELIKPLKYKSFDYEDNWDWSMEGLFGWYHNKFSSFDGKVENREKYNLYGGGLGYNNYARQEAGENLFPETQIWSFFLWTADRSVKTTYEGIPVENTDKRIDMILDVGVRQFIYNFDSIPVRTYAQAEFFGELPRNKFLNLGLGLSDRWKVLFAEVGTQIDLKKGKLFNLADAGIDAPEGVRAGIGAYRRSKLVSGLEKQYGITISYGSNGAIIINQNSQNQEMEKEKETEEKEEMKDFDPSGISPIQTEF